MTKMVKRWLMLAAASMVAMLGAACTEPIHHGLLERQANEMIVVLEQHGIEASKEPDPTADEVWRVTVPSAMRVEAWHVLQNEGLPRPDVSGFDEFYPSGGLVPTASEERILLQFSTAQELRESLLDVDGVVAARVNLVLPEKPRVQLETTVIEPPRASVLIKHRAADEAPPLDQAQVRRLVAGGVEGLDGERVEVIFTRAMRSARPLEQSEFATVGPVSVAGKSKGVFQVMIAAMGLCIVLLAAGLVYLVFRMRREPAGAEVAQ